MPKSRSHKCKRFPNRLILTASIVTVLGFGGLCWVNYSGYRSSEATADQLLWLQRLRADLLQLNDGAQPAAATAMAASARQHSDLCQRASTSAAIVIQAMPERAARERLLAITRELDAACRELARLETQASVAAKTGQMDRVGAILTGESYRAQRQRFVANVDRLRREIDDGVDGVLHARQRNATVAFVIASLLTLAMVFVWGTVAGYLRRWQGRQRQEDDSSADRADMRESAEIISMRETCERLLLRQSQYDGLTDLPNRDLALDQLTVALERAAGLGMQVMVMFIDLDHFKKVNDTLGHVVGDRLLVEAARRLRTCVRPGDAVARLGGDEFLITLPDLETPAVGEAIAHDILDAFSEPFGLEQGYETAITASIGLTVAPDDGSDPHTLLRNADAAMYCAKEAGRSTYRFFTPEMKRQAIQRLEMEFRLRRALEQDELCLYYQPVVDLRTGDVVGAEALLRWCSPELGLVSPHQFIPLAEDTGLIISIGEWVLQTACQQVSAWRKQLGKPLHIAVNVSCRQLADAGFPGAVQRALATSGLPAEALELEITENLLMKDTPETTATLNDLSGLGIALSIDDFGVGYSSLSYLKRFPFDILKIDQSFVRDVLTDADDAALAAAIIALAQSLGLRVVGEGVEYEGQLDFLRAQGCDLAQGFYISKPMPADAFLEQVTACARKAAGVGERQIA